MHLEVLTAASVTDDACREATSSSLPDFTLHVSTGPGDARTVTTDADGIADLGLIGVGTYQFYAQDVPLFFSPHDAVQTSSYPEPSTEFVVPSYGAAGVSVGTLSLAVPLYVLAGSCP